MADMRNRFKLPIYIALHPANRGHVLRALARAIRFQCRARIMRKPSIVEIGSMRMWVHLGNAAATKVVYGNPPDWSEMQAWTRLLGDGDLFIDVGANVGTYSLWAASCGAKVIAVEPAQEAAERLRDNVALNPDTDIEIVEAALSDHTGRVEITEGRDTVNRVGPGREVRCMTLDEIVGERRIAGVKIDVEGYEEIVLKGARRTLAQGLVDTFQIEWNLCSQGQLGHDRRPVLEMLLNLGDALERWIRHHAPRRPRRTDPSFRRGFRT